MNLKNYSSNVPMANSISRIEHKLAQAGSTHIAKSYDNERPIGMIFQIPINGTPMTFKPACRRHGSRPRLIAYLILWFGRGHGRLKKLSWKP